MDEYYKILGVRPDADDAAIEEAYQKLKAKYSKDRFLEGEAGNEAAKNLSKLEEAYDEITSARKSSYENKSGMGVYEDIAAAIKNGDINHAQELLDGISCKDAEWHYYESVVFYKKNWMNESKNQLELALKMDPENEKYKKSYEKLKAKMNFSEKQFHSCNYNANNNGADGYSQKQMGGDTCMDMCATYCCMELMCRSCCR
ncbi:MAG: DnaJ domain-containing protein [Clostridia bacterium]|nr:DnaJ domain-containing protein [Clostridia bacterium]